MFENALISRRIIADDDADFAIMEEVWDCAHPDCPFVFLDRNDANQPSAGLNRRKPR